jgi:hypothetical protein
MAVHPPGPSDSKKRRYEEQDDIVSQSTAAYLSVAGIMTQESHTRENDGQEDSVQQPQNEIGCRGQEKNRSKEGKANQNDLRRVVRRLECKYAFFLERAFQAGMCLGLGTKRFGA